MGARESTAGGFARHLVLEHFIGKARSSAPEAGRVSRSGTHISAGGGGQKQLNCGAGCPVVRLQPAECWFIPL